jgi:hypothetical protein
LLDVRAMTRAALLEARNEDGGWAYLPQAHTRLEPSCWAALALAHVDRREVDIDWLRRWPTENGWLSDVPSAPPNITFNALAALTLLQSESGHAFAERLITRLISIKGNTYRNAPELRQDNSLAAWSWIEGTISWVEPTAWCLLALKQRRKRHGSTTEMDARIDVGERMLIDRACRDGGWNYGNSRVYESDLLPHVPTTALALLAMQDRRTSGVVQRSLARLRRDVDTERSAVALSLSAICFRAYGEPSAETEQALLELCASRRAVNDDNENHHGMAMALYALSSMDAAPNAFTL